MTLAQSTTVIPAFSLDNARQAVIGQGRDPVTHRHGRRRSLPLSQVRNEKRLGSRLRGNDGRVRSGVARLVATSVVRVTGAPEVKR